MAASTLRRFTSSSTTSTRATPGCFAAMGYKVKRSRRLLERVVVPAHLRERAEDAAHGSVAGRGERAIDLGLQLLGLEVLLLHLAEAIGELFQLREGPRARLQIGVGRQVIFEAVEVLAVLRPALG